jgi:uncharacterized protein (DUF58 family)
MLPKEIIHKIRRIQITTNRLVNQSLAGEYHSVFKGRGMEFDEVREYLDGDDARTIDWNVTSRAGRPFIKRYVEERELTVMLLIDASSSGAFGSTDKLKSEIVAEISALLAFSAIKNNDRVGAIFFTDSIVKFTPPRRGSRHVLRVIRDILFLMGSLENEKKLTCIQKAVEYLNLVVRKRSVIFLISDLLDQGFDRSLRAANRKHDIIAVQVVDPRERELPNVGIVELRDAETNEIVWVDTSFEWVRNTVRENWDRNQARLAKFFESHRMDHVTIETGKPYDIPLVRFFKERAKRIR